MSIYNKSPSWFSLESYKANENILSKYSEYLAAQLEYRRLIIAYLELAQDHSDDIPNAIFDAIKNHTFPSDIQVYEALAKFGINRPIGLRYCRLGDIDEPVKELDYGIAYKLREIIPEDDLNKLHTAYSSNSNIADEYIKHSVTPLELTQLESTSFTDRCLEMENKDYLASRLPRRRIFLSIDLDASNEDIRRAFDSKVGQIRKRNHQLGYNKNRTSISLKKRKNIVESRLFPYLDLKIFSMLEGLSYGNENYVEIIHNDKPASLTETAFRKSTLHHAEECLNTRFIQNLYLQSEAEQKSRNP